MLFSFTFAIILLLHLGVHGQNNENDRLNNVGKGFPFGKLRIFEGGQQEEVIPGNVNEKIPSKSDSSPSVQPLPSPCIGSAPLTKFAHPKDKTKYIQCRDEFHYEIFTCPNGGEYIEQTDSCELTIPMVDKCEQEKPCLNGGQCTLQGNSTFKCICRADWTGERCETPMNSCVKKPCGPNADCRPLKSADYDQDYVCVCKGSRTYGLNCQETVPNPCSVSTEQFFPFAFSQRAYIQCDGELIFFQPCGPSLYWHQEEKVCDRKRPPKIDLPTLLTKYAAENPSNQQQTEINIEETTSTTTTTTTTTEQPEPQKQFPKDNEPVMAFVPARVAHRQQFQTDSTRQPFQTDINRPSFQTDNNRQPFQTDIYRPSFQTDNSRQLFQTDIKQQPFQTDNTRQPFQTDIKQQQFQTENSRQPFQTDINRQQFQTENSRQPFQTDINRQQFQTDINRQQIQIDNSRQPFQTDNNRQINSFSQNEQQPQELPRDFNQIRQDNIFQAKQWPNRQMEFHLRKPASAMLADQKQSSPTEVEQRSRTLPEDSENFDVDDLTTKENQQQPNFPLKQQSFGVQQWSNLIPEKSIQGIQRFVSNNQLFRDQNQRSTFETTTTTPPPTTTTTTMMITTTKESNTVSQNIFKPDQSKSNRLEKQFTGFQSPQGVDFNSQNFAQQPTSWQTSQSFPSQTQTFMPSPGQNPVQLPGSQNFNTQFPVSQSQQPVGFPTQNNQNVFSQSQPWPASQNQRPTFPTSTFPTNANPFPAFQNPNTQVIGSQGQQQLGGFQSQNFAGQQPSWQNPQPFQNQQPFIPTTTFPTPINQFPAFQNPNTQVGVNQMQQPGSFQSQNFAGQQPSWQNPPTFPSHQPFTETATIPSNINNPFQTFQGGQGSQLGGFNNQNFNQQSQPWKKQNNEPVTETSTIAQITVRPPVTQTPSALQQDQSWQNKQNTRLTGSQFTFQNNQNFPSKQQSRLNSQSFPNEQQSTTDNFDETRVDNSKIPLNTEILQNDRFTSDKQVFPQKNQFFGAQQSPNKLSNQNILTNQRFISQSDFQNQNQQSFLPTTTIASNINRFQGLQKPSSQILSIQNQPNSISSSQGSTFQSKPWQDSSKQTFNTIPSSETVNNQFQKQGSRLTADFDQSPIPTTTIANRPSFSMNEPRNQQSNQVPTTGEQRKTLDTIPTLLSGSWKSRV